MVSTFIGLLDIQSWWEIPCIAHFCSLFSSAFNLPDIDIEDLESALLTDGTDDTVGLLPELIVSLLKGCDALRSQRNEITTSNYQMFLRRFLRHQCRQFNTENYFDTDIDFQSLPLRNKLLILYSLCHFRLDSKNVQDILSNLEADSLRVEPLGYDSKNSGYWYFYGTRLYREDVKAGGKNSVWQVICFTEEDWQNLATKFQNSTSPKERALYNILAENFLPKLPQLFRERERLRRRKLLQVRNSVRIRSIVEEKQKQLENHQAELLERQKLEEQLKQEAANKAKGRARRRSSQSSTASGISTYASSIRAASTNSSEFLYQREKFCLSPDVEDNQSSPRGENAPDNLPAENNLLNEDLGEDLGDKTPKSSSEEKNRRQKGSKRKSNSQESSRENISADSLDQEDKENCCFLPSNPSESELSGAESQSSALKLEMAPTNNIKLPGRQTNNSLSTLTGNIFLPTVFGNNTSSTAATESTKPKDKPSSSTSVSNSEIPNRKKKAKGSEVFTETDEVLQIGMHKVLLYVKNHRDAWPFMDPVEEDIAPRYYSIIRRPMDLLKMEEKLDNGEYAKFSEFRNDFKLIVNNCRLYNGQNNEYTEMVNNLQEAFDKATKKYFEHISSDEEGNMSYPDSKTNVFREKYFNKTNTNKITQNDAVKKGKEKDKEREKHEKFDTGNEKSKVEEVMEGSRANKRKRKDKDKRRKKKSKTKASTRSEEEGNEDEDSNEDEPVASPEKHHETVTEEESSAEDLKKTKRKFSVGKKMPEHRKKREASPEVQSSSSSKKSKKRSESSKGEDSEENKKSKPISSKKSEDKSGSNKKQSKANKNSKGSSKKNPVHSDNEGDVSSLEEEEVTRTELRSEKEFSSDNTIIDYAIQEKLKKKHSSSLQSKTAHTSSDRPKSTNSTSTKGKEKENQSAKSKTKRSTSSTSASATEEVEKTRIFHKDNRRDSSSSKKKRNKSLKKLEESQGSEENLLKDQTRSRSPSPLYKVDLHKKYAKSASDDIENELDDNKNKFALANNSNSKRSIKKDDADDLMSISSRSLSHSPSPTLPLQAPVEMEVLSSEKRHNSTVAKKKSNSSSSKNRSKSPPSSKPTQETEMKLSPFMDKYDLIKQRRNRNTDEKWKQIVKEAEKIKDNKKTVLSKPVAPVPSKEKNQKLRETIEKLKAKNAKSKERSVLIDEIFGVKPTQEIRDEKMIFEKIRETCLDSKSPCTANKKAGDIELKKKEDEYNFVDCFPSAAAPIKSNKKKEGTETKKQRSLSPKKTCSKKNPSPANLKKPSTNNKTNMEALELETEQTLKDINRWLEHTPRFPEFSSASNSPSRYNLLDDFDAVASKLDPNDFRRSVPITPKIDSVPKLADTIEEIVENKPDVIPDLIPSATNSAITNDNPSITSLVNTAVTAQPKSKDSNTPNTTQLLPHPPPPPPHIKTQLQKETKRKTLKDKVTNRRKDLLRTIDRLQPGKAKGNLISNIHNTNKPDEMFPLGAAAKIKEVKNSLVVKTDETAPKLSLGSVLNTEGFGLGQLHNFGDITSGDLKIGDSLASSTEPGQEKKNDNSPVHEAIDKIEETVKKEEPEMEEVKVEKSSATPNLSAWFKAFGAPKKAKKIEEEEKKVETIEGSQSTIQEKLSISSEQANSKNPFNTLKSPTSENFSLPAPRQRKASTGSTISERSSFSQDPDSPRVGIDDRFGSYSGPYASPIGASPIMVSPKPEELTKPTSPYPLNGAIKVGFYQDTTTKSSPEKSCSPRELPSPYPQYSQHIYTSASSPNVNNDIGNTFSGCYTAANEANKSTMYASASPSPLYEQYKQPQSQESDYNSMSPSTNPNSPYQQPQNSPYQQHQTSPYQQAQNSPYQQPQTSPFQGQSATTQNILQTQSPNPQQPNIQQQSQPQKQPQQQQTCESPRGPNSPYQQPITSPYQQPLSPYNQSNPTSPYQQQQPQQQQQTQQANLGFSQQQNTTSPTMDSSQQVAAVERPFSQENTQYPLHERNPQYQEQSQNAISYEQEMQKSPSNIMNKLQPQPEWNNPMDVTSQPVQSTPNNLSNMNPLPAAHIPNQLNTPPLQPVQAEEMTAVHHLQQEGNKDNLPYQRGYQQYAAPNKELPKPQNIFNNDLSLEMLQQRQMAAQEHLVKANPSNAPKNTPSSETDLLNLGYPDQQKMQKPEDKPFDSTLNKHQQMFDSFLGSMAAGKNLGFGKPLDISTSKAFEMFNRAATMGFSKDFPNALMGGNKSDVLPTTISNSNVSQPPQIPQQQQQHLQSYHTSGGKMMESPTSNANVSSKPLTMVNNAYNQPQQMQMNQADSNKLQTFHNVDSSKLHQQQSAAMFAQKLAQQHQPNAYHANLVQSPAVDKINNELVIPNPRQDQMSGIGRNQHINMDLPNYKQTFNNPSAMLDPLRNLNHPLAMVDESMLGLQNSTPTGYYEKNIPPAHMLSKNLGQVYQSPSPYVAREPQNPTSAYVSPVSNVPTAQPLDGIPIDPKVSKRTKKKKSSTPTPVELINTQNQNAMLSGQQQLPPLQGQPHPGNQVQQSTQNPQQGFQLYAGLKTAVPATTDTSAISLKSATSMVPGSAFNFGPSPTGLGIPTGIYGDNSGYLEEFRGAPNPYYIPPGHRATPDTKPDAAGNGGAPTPSSYHQFLTHTSSRSSYPFMNSPQLDPNSPIYQQYLQQEELRTRMILNQGLLGPGAAAGYHPQPGYRPALGMPKPYNRQPWF